MDAQRWDSGERIVFEPYSREMYEQSFEWIEKHGIFDAGKMGDGSYEKATVGFGALRFRSSLDELAAKMKRTSEPPDWRCTSLHRRCAAPKCIPPGTGGLANKMG
jgi:hypothetical protein